MAATREIEKWVTISGRRIPIFKKEGSQKIRGFAKPKGNPELTYYGRFDGKFVSDTYTDYPNKQALIKDMRSNGIKNLSVLDKRDNYIIDHSNYGGVANAYKDYLFLKKYGLDTTNVKSLLDKANKVYLQKQKRYKLKNRGRN